MSFVDKTQVFHVDINKLYETIIDYASYPEFVDGVDSIEIIESNETKAVVKYSINMIKEFSYTIELTQEKPNKVSWRFLDGDIFKRNDGGWTLVDLGDGKTEANYRLDVEFKMLVPKMVSNKLVKQNLPTMMKAFEQRAQSRN